MQLTELKNEIEVFETFEAFTEAQEAIAAFRIQHLRDSVIKNRLFLTEIGDLYDSIKQHFFAAQQKSLANRQPPLQGQVTQKQPPKDNSDKRSLLNLFGSQKEVVIDPKSIRFLGKNGKNIAILLTSNTGFYGGILKNLFDNFVSYILANKTDVAVVGKAGKIFFEELLKKNNQVPKNYIYFDLDDDEPSPADLEKIIAVAKNYDGIVIHYVQFFSVLTQIPYYTNIAGEIGLLGNAGEGSSYIYEPSYEEILIFFETQILEAIFSQKVYEHQLARYGSKLVAMDDAVSSSKVEVAKLQKRKTHLKKQILNKKQQEVFSAIFGLEQGVNS